MFSLDARSSMSSGSLASLGSAKSSASHGSSLSLGRAGSSQAAAAGIGSEKALLKVLKSDNVVKACGKLDDFLLSLQVRKDLLTTVLYPTFPEVLATIFGFTPSRAPWIRHERRPDVLRLLLPNGEGSLFTAIFEWCTYPPRYAIPFERLPPTTFRRLSLGDLRALSPWYNGKLGNPKAITVSLHEFFFFCFVSYQLHRAARYVPSRYSSSSLGRSSSLGKSSSGFELVNSLTSSISNTSFGALSGGVMGRGRSSSRYASDVDTYQLLLQEYLFVFFPHVGTLSPSIPHQTSVDFLLIMAEWWLNQNTDVEEQLTEEFRMPTSAMLECIQRLILHLLADPTFQRNQHIGRGGMSDHLRLIQRNLFIFFRASFKRWPLDSLNKFSKVVRLWLLYLQPWSAPSLYDQILIGTRANPGHDRSSSPSRSSSASSSRSSGKSSSRNGSSASSSSSSSSASASGISGRGANAYSDVWRAYVMENFPFYTLMVRWFMRISHHLDYNSMRNVNLLAQVLGAFNGGVLPVVQHCERLITGQDLTSDSRGRATMLRLRQQLMEYTGIPPHQYIGMADDNENRVLASELLNLVRVAAHNNKQKALRPMNDRRSSSSSRKRGSKSSSKKRGGGGGLLGGITSLFFNTDDEPKRWYDDDGGWDDDDDDDNDQDNDKDDDDDAAQTNGKKQKNSRKSSKKNSKKQIKKMSSFKRLVKRHVTSQVTVKESKDQRAYRRVDNLLCGLFGLEEDFVDQHKSPLALRQRGGVRSTRMLTPHRSRRHGGRVSAKGIRQVKSGQRVCSNLDVEFVGDVWDQPVMTHESEYMVILTQRLSDAINRRLFPPCNVPQCVQPAAIGTVDDDDEFGEAGPRCWDHGGSANRYRFRVVLRPLASYRVMVWVFVLLLFLYWLLFVEHDFFVDDGSAWVSDEEYQRNVRRMYARQNANWRYNN
eukprot:TRINITY_DN59374_c0_g1_i1.p1 TRINITY_DN59374_c0_g1~~TRINITY_DN59374_c0_g1_i1.p1  ORF type:complete len:935 (-),score=432.53 TRINITY_DN59374_c0_g1_i1:36-2840(-)